MTKLWWRSANHWCRHDTADASKHCTVCCDMSADPEFTLWTSAIIITFKLVWTCSMNNICLYPPVSILHIHCVHCIYIIHWHVLGCHWQFLCCHLPVWLQLPALVPHPSHNIIYICYIFYIYIYIYINIPFSWICSLYVLFCFEDFYASLFSYAVCNCDQSFLNINRVNACNKELGVGGGGGGVEFLMLHVSRICFVLPS